MKFKALNNEPFQFYNTAGELVGTIMISGSGDMILRPESGSSQDVLLGNPNQVGDVEMGAAGIPINLKLLGGGTITGNGNTLNIGSASDIVNIYNVVYSQSFDVTGSLNVTGSVTANTFVGDGVGVTGIISSSYALTASHALSVDGGGGGSPGGSDTQVQFNDGGSFGGDAGFTFNKTTNSITAITNITASGNISASGTIVGSNLSGTNTGDQDLSSYAQTANVVANSATASFITNAQTSSMSVLTSSFAVTASHALNAGAATNFTQSLFVTPTGDDSTAVVGDMLKPFQTILAATHSANEGDTIIVYPGVYFPSAQIGKDRVNYYFYPGAIVSGSIQLLSGTYEKLNIRGHGTFKTKYNGAPVGCTANGYFECDTVEFAGLQSSGYAGSPTFAQNVSADSRGILQLKGDYKYGLDDTARVGNGFNAAMRFGAGNIIANCNCFVSSSSNMMGIEIATTTTTDVIFNGDVFASNGRAVYTNDRASHVTLTGRFQTGDQGTYDAIYITPAYIGRYIINGEILGSIRIDTGETGDSGIQIDGFQECSSSPNNAAVRIDGGYNTLNHTVRASEVIFDVNGGETHFYGSAYVSSNSTGKLFDVSAGKFVWNGMNTGTNIRALSNVVSGGELVINGPLEHYGSSYPNNTECFALSGGTLEINNKVRYHQNTTGSGIVDMSGGYLKLNGAELVHNDGTGSYAYCIKLNGAARSGSILNNSFTNLVPFSDDATFTNEIVGGGTLFESDKLY